MWKTRFYTVAIVCLAASATLQADPWQRPKETAYQPSAGPFQFRVIPAPSDHSKPRQFGQCKGELWRTDEKDHKLVWSRNLINDISPVLAFVADSGKYVVTIGQWFNISELPLVIYGDNGRLIKAHSIESLTIDSDLAPYGECRSLDTWNEGAVVFFDKGCEFLFVHLIYGKTLIVRLFDGQLVDSEWALRNHVSGHALERWKSLKEFGGNYLRDRALVLLKSDVPRERWSGAKLAKEYRLQKALPLLKGLMSDQSNYTRIVNDLPPQIMFYVRDAAAEAIEAIEAELPDTHTQATTTAKSEHP